MPENRADDRRGAGACKETGPPRKRSPALLQEALPPFVPEAQPGTASRGFASEGFREQGAVENTEVRGAVIGAGLRRAAADAGGNAEGAGSGTDAGFDVGVLAVARHEEFGGVQIEAFHHHPEHVGIGFSEDAPARNASGGLQARRNRAAVHEPGRFRGGAEDVGMRGEPRDAVPDPPGGAAEAAVVQRLVECRDDGIGTVVRRIVGLLKTEGPHFLPEILRAEQEEAFEGGKLRSEGIGDTQDRGHDLFPPGERDAHAAEAFDVGVDAPRRVVGDESPGDAVPGERVKERKE